MEPTAGGGRISNMGRGVFLLRGVEQVRGVLLARGPAGGAISLDRRLADAHGIHRDLALFQRDGVRIEGSGWSTGYRRRLVL